MAQIGLEMSIGQTFWKVKIFGIDLTSVEEIHKLQIKKHEEEIKKQRSKNLNRTKPKVNTSFGALWPG